MYATNDASKCRQSGWVGGYVVRGLGLKAVNFHLIENHVLHANVVRM